MMKLTAEEIVNNLNTDGMFHLINSETKLPEKVVDFDKEKNIVFIKGMYDTVPFTLDYINENYEEATELSTMEYEYKHSQPDVFPHEPLAALCYVFDDFYTGLEHEVIFTVPVDWLIGKLDEQTGKRYWDQYKLFMWLNEEYTSDDSEWVWEQAVEENKLVTFTISY